MIERFDDRYNTQHEFSWDNLENLVKFMKQKKWKTFSCLSYLKSEIQQKNKNIVIRVDVDRSIKKALKMAKLFRKHTIRATFFFRLHSPFYNILSFESMRILAKIEKYGFEMGLHCEPVDLYHALKKNPEKLFQNDIDILNLLLEKRISGVASHGDNSGYNNLDFWSIYRPDGFNLKYEAYGDELNLFKHSIYISDSPLTHWKSYKNGILDVDNITNIMDFFLKYKKDTVYYLLLHPFVFRKKHFFEEF